MTTPTPTPEATQVAVRYCECGHREDQHMERAGCVAYASPSGDMVADYIRGNYCGCAGFRLEGE